MSPFLLHINISTIFSSRDTTLKSWDLTTGKELQTFGGHTETVTCVISVDASCSCLIGQCNPVDIMRKTLICRYLFFLREYFRKIFVILMAKIITILFI